ncbi:uncharacterized protein LOC113357096 isoform X1 [Papaver somniferum]|uniref:uncharacterized protein LOC113357096 isoform X1 n=1 Tax=Papaver somniferum TaxID=3469 RepID=UPI000E6FC545|nr:uncharacterized protein LOC113357096 isoform X1 [Papaver somniferum]XP_026456153.1 uncharacterized protein LOC113357096 isoform X1 [Papaver somniferum]
MEAATVVLSNGGCPCLAYRRCHHVVRLLYYLLKAFSSFGTGFDEPDDRFSMHPYICFQHPLYLFVNSVQLLWNLLNADVVVFIKPTPTSSFFIIPGVHIEDFPLGSAAKQVGNDAIEADSSVGPIMVVVSTFVNNYQGKYPPEVIPKCTPIYKYQLL